MVESLDQARSMIFAKEVRKQLSAIMQDKLKGKLNKALITFHEEYMTWLRRKKENNIYQRDNIRKSCLIMEKNKGNEQKLSKTHFKLKERPFRIPSCLVPPWFSLTSSLKPKTISNEAETSKSYQIQH